MVRLTPIVLLLFIIQNSFYCQSIFSPEQLQQHVSVLAADSLEGRGFGTNEKARQYIINEFKKAGLEPIHKNFIDEFSVRVANIRVFGKNVVGIVPGQDPVLKNEFILLGAHYDHLGYEIENGTKVVYNGADDNASGVAAIIEIGKKLNEKKELLKRSVLIAAFDGEETGLHGSRQFVAEETVDISKVKFMFSLDMVGMYDQHGGVDLGGLASLENGKDILNKVKEDVNIGSTGKSISYRTDTQPFGKRGIPAVHVFTGTESPYHKPEDDAHLLDYDGMAEICGLIYRFTIEASGTSALEPVKSLDQEAEKSDTAIFSSGFRLNSGSSYHVYRDEFYRGKSVIAIETGLYSQLRLAKHWRLQPEVLYELKGSKHPGGNLRMHAITVPMNVLLTTGDPVGFQPMGFLLVGGYYSYNFAGTINGERIDFDNIHEMNEYGISFGVGFQFRKTQVGFYSKYGLNDITQTTGDVMTRTSYFSFGMGF